MTQADFFSILPIITILLWALALLVADLWIPKERKSMTALLAAVGLAVGVGLSLSQVGQTALTFKGMLMLDNFAVFLNIIFLVSGILAIALSYDYLKRMGIERGEYYVLLMFSIAGMMLLTQAYNLIVVFLAIEFLSIPLYILAGFARPRLESEEAALKYFLLGTFSSGFLLYGIALIFGATKSTGLKGIMASLNANEANLVLFIAGAALMLVGFGFKVPRMGAGCVPGVAYAGFGIHGGLRQSCRFCRFITHLPDRLPDAGAAVNAGGVGCRRADHGGR